MLREGQELGNYRVVRKIGTGGMGMVYLAEHPVIGKKVALKVIHRDLAARPEVLLRFSNEAKAVGKVAGDHIVPIHDFGTTPDGECYYVMDYLEGRTLAHEVASGRPMDVQRALYIAAQLTEVLSTVHQQGVLHRDLKPDNVMLVDRNGDPDYVMLLDFGLAKFLGGAASGPKLTAEGMLLGTPQFMSPEAAEAKGDLDHRSDQYSVGVLLFQMLTGRLPFDGESMGAVLVQQVSKPPPPLRGLSSQVPPAVEQLVLRSLAKNRDDRFADMKAMRRAILDPAAYLASQPPIMPVSPLAADDQETLDRPVPDDRRKTRGEFPVVAPHPPAHARVTEPEVTAVSPPIDADEHQATAELEARDRRGGVHARGTPGGRTAQRSTVQGTPRALSAQRPTQVASGPLPAAGGGVSGQAPPQPVGGQQAGGQQAAGGSHSAGGPQGSGPLWGHPQPAGGTQPAAPPMGPAPHGPQMDPALHGPRPFGPQMGPHPGMARPVPVAAENKTMGIATPMGHVGLEPAGKSRWGVALLLLLVLAGATTAVVVLVIGDERGSGEPAATETDAAPAAASRPEPTPDAAPPTVELSVVSDPSGAEVFDQDGERLGVTPLELRVPRADESRTLRLVHPDAEEREKSYDASRDIAIDVELERRPRPRPGKAVRRSGGKGRKGAAAKGKAGKGAKDLGKDGVLRPKL